MAALRRSSEIQANTLGLEHIGSPIEFYGRNPETDVGRVYGGTLVRYQCGDTHLMVTLAPDTSLGVSKATWVKVLSAPSGVRSITETDGPTGPPRKIRGLDS